MKSGDLFWTRKVTHWYSLEAELSLVGMGCNTAGAIIVGKKKYDGNMPNTMEHVPSINPVISYGK